VSPPGYDAEDEAEYASASLDRQLEFIQAILPDTIETHIIRLYHVSAYSGPEVVDQVHEVLDIGEGRAMVVSSALDRVLRSQANAEHLQKMLKTGDHMAMSLLWDCATIITPQEAMFLPPAV
jgi:hypothetical protein